METIQLLVEAPTDTTDHSIEEVLQTQWDIVVVKITSMHTFTCKKFWVTALSSRRISSLLDSIEQYGEMMIVYDMGYLGMNPKYWKVSLVQMV
jgi:hypothetical protein